MGTEFEIPTANLDKIQSDREIHSLPVYYETHWSFTRDWFIKSVTWIYCAVEVIIARMLSCVPTMMEALLVLLLCEFEGTLIYGMKSSSRTGKVLCATSSQPPHVTHRLL